MSESIGRQASAQSDDRFKTFDDMLHQSDLEVERFQNVAVRDWHDFGKNYVAGYLGLYLKIAPAFDGDDRCFHLFFVKVGGVHTDFMGGGSSPGLIADRLPASGGDAHSDQTGSMFVGVGDCIHCPEGIVPSWVWLLTQDERPLFGRKFLFYSCMSRCWEWLRIPVLPYSSEREGDPRGAAIVGDHDVGDHFVQCGSQVANKFNDLKADIGIPVAFDAGDYLKRISIRFPSMGEPFIDETVDDRFKIVELSLSTFDLFV